MKKLYILIPIVFVIVLVLAKCINSDKDTVFESIYTNVGSLSNKKIGWGIKRVDNHEQPDLGAINRKLIEEYDGLAMGNKEEKNIYLTFDMGYEAGYTEKILDTLNKNEVKATFFITAHYLNTHPELVERMIKEGHIVGNHTVNHKSMPDLSEREISEEIMKLHSAVYEKFGYEMKYIRPPKGEYSERTLAIMKNLGYTTVMWSFAYDDWEESKQGREDYGKKKILDNVHNGEIMLLHGTSKDNSNILDSCIKEIKNEGYFFKSLDEFIR